MNSSHWFLTLASGFLLGFFIAKEASWEAILICSILAVLSSPWYAEYAKKQRESGQESGRRAREWIDRIRKRQ